MAYTLMDIWLSDLCTAAPSRPQRKSFRSHQTDSPWGRASKRCGQRSGTTSLRDSVFIARASGGKEVFVRACASEQAGITGLKEGRRVSVGVTEGQRDLKPPRSMRPISSGPHLVTSGSGRSACVAAACRHRNSRNSLPGRVGACLAGLETSDCSGSRAHRSEAHGALMASGADQPDGVRLRLNGRSRC